MPGRGWTVSHSAPIFDPKEEQEERDNLSPQEYQFIEDELHGIQVFDYASHETPERLQAYLDEFDACLENIPATEKAAYQEAMAHAPQLVQQETNPVMFLRCEYYNVEAAARRLATHWTQRKLLFGNDRWLLPLRLGGNGAMTDDDLFQLKLGHVTYTQKDEFGRPVIFLDRTSSTRDVHYSRDGWLRAMWYILHTVCQYTRQSDDEKQDNVYQKTGYVVIINLRDYEPTTCGDRLGAKKMFLYVRECWCPRFVGYHATYGSHQTPVKLVEPAVRQMQGRHIRLHLRNHYGFDSDNLAHMAEYGIRSCHVSTVIGGSHTKEQHLQWVQERLQYDASLTEQEQEQDDATTSNCKKNERTREEE